MTTSDLTEDMRQSVQALTVGWTESIRVPCVDGGSRRVVRRFGSLLSQLAANTTVPLPSRIQGPGGGGKAGSRPTLNMAYSNCIDTIQEGVITAWALLERESPQKLPLPMLLAELCDSVEQYSDDREYDCQTVARMARKWVHDARVLLGYESRQVILVDTVCGECEGTLAVAVDATSDVRCVGTEHTEPCGKVYGRLEWVTLLG